MSQLQPLYDLLVIEPADIQGETQTASGLIVPETVREKPNEGIVLAAGQGRIARDGLVPLLVKVGDHVLYARFSGTEVSADGKKLLILHESDVLAVVGE